MAQASRNRKSMYYFFFCVNFILNFIELFELEILEVYVSRRFVSWPTECMHSLHILSRQHSGSRIH